jgi:hypothetical protein
MKQECKSQTCGDHTFHFVGEGRCEKRQNTITTDNTQPETQEEKISKFYTLKEIDKNEMPDFPNQNEYIGIDTQIQDWLKSGNENTTYCAYLIYRDNILPLQEQNRILKNERTDLINDVVRLNEECAGLKERLEFQIEANDLLNGRDKGA